MVVWVNQYTILYLGFKLYMLVKNHLLINKFVEIQAFKARALFPVIELFCHFVTVSSLQGSKQKTIVKKNLLMIINFLFHKNLTRIQ